MSLKTWLTIFLLVGAQITVFAQEKTYKVGAIGFYNFENLFDTLDNPDIRDEEFTPSGSKLYGTEIYTEKMDHLTEVVAKLGTELTPDGISILGVSEIENRKVLEDFVAHPQLKDRNYQIIHYDSPDRRGIDVAMIYQPKYFEVTHSEALPLKIYDEGGDRIYTRDILYVAGEFDGDPIHLFVNHWPSRRGGESASMHLRMAGAMVCKQVIDSLTAVNPDAKVVVMGDLNDDPVSPSVRQVLNAKRKPNQARKGELYNPMWDLYRKGFGTLAWRDAWSLFDQIILSSAWLEKDQDGYYFHQVKVFNERYLVQKTGNFKGYPFRTFAGDTYLGGYSDHFPVYMFILKEVVR